MSNNNGDDGSFFAGFRCAQEWSLSLRLWNQLTVNHDYFTNFGFCLGVMQSVSLSPLSIFAQRSIQLAVQNQKYAIGSVCPKHVSISTMEEYGASAFSLVPNHIYIQPILLYGSETWALEDKMIAVDNICPACIIFSRFLILMMLLT